MGGCTLELVLPDEQWNSFEAFMLKLYQNVDLGCQAGTFTEVWSRICKVRVQDAVATYSDDQANILSIIAPHVPLGDKSALAKACESHNNIICLKLQDWLFAKMVAHVDSA